MRSLFTIICILFGISFFVFSVLIFGPTSFKERFVSSVVQPQINDVMDRLISSEVFPLSADQAVRSVVSRGYKNQAVYFMFSLGFTSMIVSIIFTLMGIVPWVSRSKIAA